MTQPAKPTAPDTAPQEALREEILSDARHQAERLLRRAQQEAKTLTEKADAELETWRNEHLEQAKTEAARRARLISAGISLERSRMRAQRVETLLQELYEDTRQRCADRATLDVRQTVITLAAEAVCGMAGTQFIIEIAACDREAMGHDWLDEVGGLVNRPDLKLEARFAEDRRDIGPVVRDADERQIWDNRLVARLERLWPEMRRELAKSLALQQTPAPTEKTS